MDPASEWQEGPLKLLMHPSVVFSRPTPEGAMVTLDRGEAS